MPPVQPNRQHSAPSGMPYHPGHRRSVTAPSVPVSSTSASSLSPVTPQRFPVPPQQQSTYHPHQHPHPPGPPPGQPIRPILQPAPPARSPVPPTIGPHPGPQPGSMQQVAGPQPPPPPGPRGPPQEPHHQEPVQGYSHGWPQQRMPYAHRYFPQPQYLSRTVPSANNDGYNFMLVCHAVREHGRPNSPMIEHVGFLLRREVMTSLSPFVDSLTKDFPPGDVTLWLDETEANVAALLEVCNLLPDKPPQAQSFHPTARQYMGAGVIATKYNFAALVPSIQYHILNAPPRETAWQFEEIAFFLNFAHTNRSPALWDMCIRYLSAWRSQLDPRRLPRERTRELDPKVHRVLLTFAACTRGRTLFDGLDGIKVKYGGVDEPYVVVEPE